MQREAHDAADAKSVCEKHNTRNGERDRRTSEDKTPALFGHETLLAFDNRNSRELYNVGDVGAVLAYTSLSEENTMSSLNQQQIDVAKEFVNVTISTLKTDRGVHAETAVAATARMAGTFLFRTFGFEQMNYPPGQAVFSEQANEHGPRLVEVLSEILGRLGVNLDKAKLEGTPGPDNQPQLGFLETQRQLEPQFAEIRTRHGLSEHAAAEAAAVATAIIMQQCAEVLDPHIAFGIAVYGFIEGTKTAPDAV